MASGIPTRRVTRRIDENAPPISTRSRSTVSIPTNSRTNSSSSLPILKRQQSSSLPIAVANSALTNIASDKENKKRSALGEVTNAPKAKALGGKTATKERVVLASTTTAQAQVHVPAGRRTRTSLAASNDVVEVVKEDRLALKKKALSSKVPLTKRVHPSTTASSSTALKPTRSQPSAQPRDNAHTQPILDDHAAKRRRTSTPPAKEEDELDEANFDQDGQEIILSSGGRGVSMKSPKRKTRRAKDEGWTDLDAEDEGDPTMVSEYVVDAFNYMLEIEKRTMPSPTYMDNQAEIQWKMRGVLMDWIIECHSKFRLLPETLFIATNLIDRFLSIRVVSLVKLQLVGLTALFVAAKYEEVICPSVTHFLQMTDGGYDVEEILKAERYLLSTLNFDLSYPNPLHFLRRISKADAYDVQTRTVAKYLIELSCVEHRLLEYTPSMLAAAAMWLARFVLERDEWTPNLIHYSTYSEAELLPCAQTMLNHLLSPEFQTSTTFFKKYAAKKFMKTSVYVQDWALGRYRPSAEGEDGDEGRGGVAESRFAGKELWAEVEGLF